MAHGYNTKLPYKHYPGNGYYYNTCDVCGWKIREKDGVIVDDTYNYWNGLWVCKDHLEKANPQTYIRSFVDRQIDNPKLIRGNPPARYILNPPSAEIPSAPQNLTFSPSAATGIALIWMGPMNSPGGTVSGYEIQRKTDNGSFTTLVANTNAVATYYVDLTAVTGHDYTYQVAAINQNGTSTFSNTATITY